MITSNEVVEQAAAQEYKYGFVTDIEAESTPPGLNEDIVRWISAKKGEPEWLLEWRLRALRHFLTLVEKEQLNIHKQITLLMVSFRSVRRRQCACVCGRGLCRLRAVPETARSPKT